MQHYSDLANTHLSAITDFPGKHHSFSTVLTSSITAACQKYSAERLGAQGYEKGWLSLSPIPPKVITHVATAYHTQRFDLSHAPQKHGQALVVVALSHDKLCTER